MWQNRLLGILGIWIVILAFLGFSESLKRILFVATGIMIAIVAFRGNQLIKPTEELKELALGNDENKKAEEEIKEEVKKEI